MKKTIVIFVGLLIMVSCGPKPGTAPSGVDILVLTSPGGAVPGNLSAIETSTGAVYDDILPGGTGEIPNEFHLRGSTLWIVNSAQGSVQLVDVSVKDGKLSISTRGRVYLPQGSYPEYMAFLGNKAYITLYTGNSVAALDTLQNLFQPEIKLPDPGDACYPTGFGPWGIAVSGTSLFLAGAGVSPGVLFGIDGNTGSITFSSQTTKANAGSIAISSDRVFVTTSDFCDSANGSLEVFSLSGLPITAVSMGTPLGAVVFSGGKAYIGDLFGSKLHIVDINTYSSRSLTLSANPGIGNVSGVRLSPKGLVYACGWGMNGGEVYEIDPLTDTVRKIYTIKGPAQDVAFR